MNLLSSRSFWIWMPAMLAGVWISGEVAAAEDSVQIDRDQITAEAFSGEPYGVGHLKVKATAGRFPILPDRPWSELTAENHRVLYPVFPVSDGEGEYWSQADRADKAGTIEALFLFKGKGPLKLKWRLPDGQTVEKTLTPQPDEAEASHGKLLREWWNRYAYAVKKRMERDAYPPQVENYLVTMLSKRLNLASPELSNPWSGRSDVDRGFGLLLGAESIRVAMQRDTVLNHTRRDEPLTRKLPKAAAPPPVTLPKFDKSQATAEPIAGHVPAECFYVRCGNFQNFQWLRSNLTHWGAMARDLTALRGWNYGIRNELEHQLALKETILSKLFGETLISDVAILGSDTFVREGASIGILFEARNSSLLKIQLDRLRQDARTAEPAAREKIERIAGHDVSFLSTPDNRIRTFYAVDGDYHLISTSREIVRRFFEAGNGKDSLAGLDEFLYARHLMPTSRDDACFVYLSDLFFRQLVGPKYRVEMTRRMKALAEIELVHLAQLAAKAEGAEHQTIHQLMDGGYLPEDFLTRPDGSHTVMENGRITDSLRGARGTFLPVADVDVDELTDSEIRAYEEFSRFYRSQWERMDPAMLALKRRPAADGRERISVDVHITPYARRHYQSLTTNLGAATPWRLVPLAGDLAQLTINFGTGAGFVRGQFGFAGVRDLPASDMKFQIEHGQVFETLTPPIYYGLLAQLETSPDQADKTKQDKPAPAENMPKQKPLADASIFFYPYDAAGQEEIRKSLKLEQAEPPAQLRLWVNRLADTQIAKVINAHSYLRSRRASAGNTRFLQVLTEQLHVEPKEALQEAKAILGAEPVCRLGGQYQLTQDDRGFGAWQSSAWKHPSYHSIQKIPADYTFPMLTGFHQLKLDFNIDRTTLSTHLDLELEAAKE